jgi:hypothetical protein
MERKALAASKLYQQTLSGRKIRLLRILPGFTLTNIECEFLYVDLDSSPDYVALSYTWGQQTPSVSVLVNRKVVQVSENLYLALLHLRKRGSTRVWVDAICINQEDLTERASQVQQMKDVYRKATVVTVWLGEEDSSSALAFDVFHEMVEHLDWEYRVPQRLIESTIGDARRLKAINDILDRPWFSRTWVIQEVLAAREVYIICGKDVISMILFLRIMRSLLLARSLGPTTIDSGDIPELFPGPAMVAIKQLQFLTEAHTQDLGVHTIFLKFQGSLLNYLSSTRWSQATDPRDKVYGLLSLAEDAGSLGYWNESSEWVPFRVDYHLSTEQVFINTAKAIISTTNSLDILGLAGGLANKAIGMPSWVPHWADKEPHIPPDYPRVVSTHESSKDTWRDDTNKSSRVRWRHVHESITFSCRPVFTFGKNDELVVTGIHFDTITALSKRTQHQYQFRSVDSKTRAQAEDDYLTEMGGHLESLHAWIDECTQLAAKCLPYPTEQDIEEALWRTLSDDFAGTALDAPLPHEGHLGNIRGALQALTCSRDKLVAMRSSTSNAWCEIVLEAAMSRLESLMAALPRPLPQQRFATTRRKYIGLVPQQTRVGDLFCVMYGCETPFILRRRRARQFGFVGHGKFQGFDFDNAVAELNGLEEQRWKRSVDSSMLESGLCKVDIKFKRTRKFTIS